MQSWEPEEAPRGVLCLVHGLGEHSGRYGPAAAPLTGAGYALFTFDLRGHGRSAGPRGHAPSYDVVMDDIDRFLSMAATRFRGLPRFLWGQSLGGALVLNYVLRCRPALAGVIVTAPALRPALDPPGWKLAAGRLLSRIKPDFQMSNGLDLSGLSHDPAVLRAYRADPLVHDRVSARFGLDIVATGPDALAHADSFPPVPLLIMHGTADRITSARASEQFARRVPGECTLKLWDGYYHELHNEPQRAEVLAYLTDWLAAHMPA